MQMLVGDINSISELRGNERFCHRSVMREGSTALLLHPVPHPWVESHFFALQPLSRLIYFERTKDLSESSGTIHICPCDKCIILLNLAAHAILCFEGAQCCAISTAGIIVSFIK